MNTNKCPHCQTAITRVLTEDITMQVGETPKKGFSYACPMCHSILGIQMNPMAILSEFKEEVVREFIS